MKYRLYKKSKSGTYFFQFLDNQRNIVLQSQAYDSKRDRDLGLRSVFKNAAHSDRYQSKELNDGKVFFSLIAKNGEEIARSPALDDSLASNYLEQCKDEIPALAQLYQNVDDTGAEPTIQQGKANEYATDGITDDYHRLSFYQEMIDKNIDGIQKFEKSGKSYFCCVKDGGVILISEAYETVSTRDDAIDGLFKSLPMAENYQRNINANDKYYFNLKAGNGSEIGTSAWFDSPEELNANIEYLQALRSDLSQEEKKAVPVVNPLSEDNSIVEHLEIAHSDVGETVAMQSTTYKVVESPIEDITVEDNVAIEDTHEVHVEEELVEELIEDEKQYVEVQEFQEPESVAPIEEKTVKHEYRSRERELDKRGGLWKWLLPLLLLPLLFFGYKSCSNTGDAKIKQAIVKQEQPVEKVKSESKVIKAEPQTQEEVIKVKTEDKRIQEPAKPISTQSSTEKITPIVKASSTITGQNIVGQLKACLNDQNCKRPIKVHWTGSRFQYNEYALSNRAGKELQELVELIKGQKNVKLEILGHIAQNEDDFSVSKKLSFNSLSEMRAKTVYDTMIKNGLSKSNLSFKGLGDSKPLSTDYIEPGFALNKRIDILIY